MLGAAHHDWSDERIEQELFARIAAEGRRDAAVCSLSLPESHTFGICALLLQLPQGDRNCLTV
jgi:hypothetical protein